MLTSVLFAHPPLMQSCRVMPVMAFRTLVVGQRYSVSQYAAGATLVAGITLFSIGDAEGTPNFHWAGIALISLALVCDAMTANLEERWFFRIRTPASHSEVMLYLSCFAAVYSGVVLVASGEVWDAVAHSMIHTSTVPMICAFSVLGYITVCLILTIIKNFGATNAEIVKSLRKVFQIAVSFMLFPKVCYQNDARPLLHVCGCCLAFIVQICQDGLPCRISPHTEDTHACRLRRS